MQGTLFLRDPAQLDRWTYSNVTPGCPICVDEPDFYSIEGSEEITPRATSALMLQNFPNYNIYRENFDIFQY